MSKSYKRKTAMAELEEKPRRSKSYRGCTPCKLARRKCTEEKPGCSHCEKIGVKCEYDTESLFRFQEFQYGKGNKKLTQSAKRAPVSKRKSNSPDTETSSKSAKTSTTSTPLMIAIEELQPPSAADIIFETQVPSLEEALWPTTDLSWPMIPSSDPFYPLFFDEEEENITPPGSAGSLTPSELPYFLTYFPASISNSDIAASDLPYFTFFLEEMSSVLPYANLFPSTVSSLLSSSLHHPALLHSLLSLSALLYSKKFDKGRERALEHLSKSLRLLQDRLSTDDVDEGVAISIFLLAYFNVNSGEYTVARKHLQGLQVILERLQQQNLVKNGRIFSPYALSPLTMLIWRMAIQMDFSIAIMYGGRPIFPVIPEDQEEFHQQWITLFVDRNQGPSATEWALAWFALDNTMHRACHASADATALRREQRDPRKVDLEIQTSVDVLLESHRKWCQRTIIREADEIEQRSQPLTPSETSSISSFSPDLSTIFPSVQPPTESATNTVYQFLEYPQLKLTDSFYNNLLNHYRSIEIYISLIRQPMQVQDPWRFEYSIDLCRTYAALGEERNFISTGKVWGLYLAGITLGGKDLYPRESQWALDRLDEIGLCYYEANLAVRNLRILWQKKGNYWDAVEEIFDESWKEEETELGFEN